MERMRSFSAGEFLKGVQGPLQGHDHFRELLVISRNAVASQNSVTSGAYRTKYRIRWSRGSDSRCNCRKPIKVQATVESMTNSERTEKGVRPSRKSSRLGLKLCDFVRKVWAERPRTKKRAMVLMMARGIMSTPKSPYFGEIRWVYLKKFRKPPRYHRTRCLTNSGRLEGTAVNTSASKEQAIL